MAFAATVARGKRRRAAAPERMQICYRYGCKADTYVNVDAGTRARLQAFFQNINSAAAERDAVRDAVQRLISMPAHKARFIRTKAAIFATAWPKAAWIAPITAPTPPRFSTIWPRKAGCECHRVGKPYRLPRIIDLHYAAQLI